MTNDAPAIVVLARYAGRDEAAQLTRALRAQTYSRTRLIFVSFEAPELDVPIEKSFELCRHDSLPARLRTCEAKYLLYWPDAGDLHDAAIEKLLLALHLAPDQYAVTDASRGLDGLLLARLDDTSRETTLRWLDSKMKWLGEVRRRRFSCFFISELLARKPCELDSPFGAVENLFTHLPYLPGSYQAVPEEPLWPMPAGAADPLSILFVVSCLPIGGACKFILDVVGQLSESGYRVTVVTTLYAGRDPNPWLGELLQIIPDVFVLTHARPAELPRVLLHLARSRRCGRVVLSHSLLGYQLLAWLRQILPQTSFTDYTHIEYESEYPDGGYALRSVHHRGLLDRSITSTDHLRSWMIERGGNAEKIQVCHTNIDVDKWKPDAAVRAGERAALGVDEKTTLILYPCRIAEQKRPDLMCNIVAALRETTRTPFLVVAAGDGPLMGVLRKFIAEHDLEGHIRLLGAVSLGRVRRLHDAADILLLPSQIEGIALALYEAMALECVPVVADVGGQRELVSPECGSLIPIGDPVAEMTAYVSALKHLLKNPAQRRWQAGACRARVAKDFPLHRMTTCFIGALVEADLQRERTPVTPAEAALSRDLVTLAVDHLRLAQQGALAQAHAHDLRELVSRRDHTIVKLQRQLAEVRAQIEEAPDHVLAG